MKKLLIAIVLIFTMLSCSKPVETNAQNPICSVAMRFNSEKTWWYDATYYKMSYPGGDIPSGGACVDVPIRVLRAAIGMDLQKLIHEDMVAHFNLYPNKWGATAPDPNIDHRRVPNIMKYFERKGYGEPTKKNMNFYEPGDIVCWILGGGSTHIGILLNKNGDVYHNIGPMAKIDKDFLFKYTIIGHYRIPLQ